MEHVKRIAWRRLAAGALGLFTAAACGGSSTGGGAGTSNLQQQYIIGASNCITGRGAAVAVEMSNGFTMAMDVLNATHPDYKLVPNIQDNQATAEVGVRVFEKLSSDGVPVIVTCGGSNVTATAPLAQREKVVILDPAGTPAPNEWVVPTYPVFQDEGRAMAQYMYGKGIKKVATYVSAYDYGFGSRDAFQKAFTGLGGQILLNLEIDPNGTDHQGNIAKIKALSPQPDAVWVVSTGTPAGAFVKQFGQAGLTMPIFGTGGFASQSVIDIGGKAAEGLSYTQLASDLTATDPTTKAFTKAFNAKYPAGSTPNPYLIAFYNSVLMADKTIKYLRDHNEKYTGENFLDAVYKVGSFPTIGGGVEKLSKSGGAQLPVGIGVIKDGKLTYATTVK